MATKKVVAKAETTKLREPGEKKNTTETVEVVSQGTEEVTDAVLKVFYLMYRCNLISRNNLKQVLQEAANPAPNSLGEFLANEAAKA